MLNLSFAIRGFVLLGIILQSCSNNAQPAIEKNMARMWFDGKDSLPTVMRTEAEWRRLLSPEAFEVLRGHGTERPFTCGFISIKSEGDFYCQGCNLHLFSTKDKFDSGTGWPSYDKPVNPYHLTYIEDRKFGMIRTEVRCAQCDGHLGHVFDDGPPPSGRRYCINGVALRFVERK